MALLSEVEARALALLDRDLDEDEGTVAYVYRDALGYWTIGRGIMVDRRRGGRLFPDEIAFINRNRMARLLAGVQREPWYPAVADDAVRLAAILNMQFQLGSGSDEAFAVSFGFIARRDWARAAANMRRSLWARQTPGRAARVIAAIETGRPR